MTGSTSIQHMLHSQRMLLAKQGAYYPDTQSDNKHLLFATMFSSFTARQADVDDLMWRGRDPARVLSDYRVSFAAEMRSLDPSIDRVIISAEQFSQMVREAQDIQSLRTFLEEFFDEWIVVIYLRRQDTHFASSYAQSLRMGKIRPPDMDRLQDWYHDYDYAGLLDRWATIFGRASMRPRLFERPPGGQFDVVQDFLSLCALTLPLPPVEVAKNPSMNLAGQRILLEIDRLRRGQANRSATSHVAWKRISKAVTAVLPGQGWQPTRSQAKQMVERFAASNEVVRREWFPERQSLFSLDFSSLPETAPQPDPAADFHDSCAVLLHLADQAVRAELVRVKEQAHRANEAANMDKRRTSLLRAITLNRDDVAARNQLAALQIASGAFDSARHNLAAAARIAPDNLKVRLLEKRLARRERDSKRLD